VISEITQAMKEREGVDKWVIGLNQIGVDKWDYVGENV
jgi:hypothetical protein